MTHTNFKAQFKHNLIQVYFWHSIIQEFLMPFSEEGKTGSTLNYTPTYQHTILMQVSLAQHILHPALTSTQCNKHILNSYIVKQALNSFGNLQQYS